MLSIIGKRSMQCIVAVIAVASSSTVFATPFTFNATGENSEFAWTSVHDNDLTQLGNTGADQDVMGSPTVTPDGFFFLNTNYDVDSNRSSINSVEKWVVANKTGTFAGATINNPPTSANPPTTTEIIVRESGTYVSNDPLNDFNILVSVSIVQEAPLPQFGFAFALKSAFTQDVNFHPDGTWDLQLTINVANEFGFTPTGMEAFRIDLSNGFNLVNPNDTAVSITKERADIIVPEPASLMVFGFVVGVAAIRRGRRA